MTEVQTDLEVQSEAFLMLRTFNLPKLSVELGVTLTSLADALYAVSEGEIEIFSLEPIDGDYDAMIRRFEFFNMLYEGMKASRSKL